ncbi:hypothetical protein ACXFAU_11825 [Paenibacillus glucanolyticus]
MKLRFIGCGSCRSLKLQFLIIDCPDVLFDQLEKRVIHGCNDSVIVTYQLDGKISSPLAHLRPCGFFVLHSEFKRIALI